MGGIQLDGNRDDVLESGIVSAVLSIGTSEVEAKAGASRLAGRQAISVYNDSNNTIYVGPSGVSTTGVSKGIPVLKGQLFQLTLGDVPYFIIAGSAGNSVIVQEFA